MPRYLIAAACALVGFAVGWLTHSDRPAARTGTGSGEGKAFVTHPHNGKRVVQSLVIDPTTDPDQAWHIEVNGKVYLCRPYE